MYSLPQPIAIHASGTTAYSGFARQINPLPSARLPHAPYFETDKLRALAVYAETGNQLEAARQTGVGQGTVHDWVHDAENDSIVAELRASVRYNEGWRLSRLVSRGLDNVERCFNEGDAVILKDGRTVYKRPSLRDSVIATSILIDKWMLISGSIANETMLLGRMDELSKQLASLGTSLNAAPLPAPLDPPIPEASGEKLMW